jgi:tetratricopeptide (TPR) repeat protein
MNRVPIGTRWSRHRFVIGTSLLLLAIGIAYSNSFGNGFHFDDYHTVVDNPAIRSLRNIPRFFTDASTFSVLPANRTYRPMVSTTLALDYAAGHGYKPFWFHLGTFLLFLLQVALLAAFYRLLLNKVRPSLANDWLALFAAGWYGLHPAMAETVNYVIQRGDLYCTLGCMAALLVYARYARLRRTGIYLVPLVFAMLSKPPAAVFPVLLFLYVFFFEVDEDTFPLRLCRSAIAAAPALFVTALLLWLQVAMTPKTFLPSILSPWDYRLTQPFVWLRYTGELFLPLHLNVDTDLAPFTGLGVRALAGLFLLGGLIAAIWASARRRMLYPIAFGLLWFVVTELPTSLYPLSEVENDHRMFFSFVGLVLAVVWAGWLLLLRVTAEKTRLRLRPVLAAMGLLMLSGYAYGVHVRNAVWHDEQSLWRDDVAKSPHNGRGLMIYGLTQMNKGEYAAALDEFERALLYTPNYATLEINLGIVNGAMADQERGAEGAALSVEAKRHFERAITLAPGDDAPHAYYGRWLEEQGRLTDAILQLKTAIALDPQRVLQHELLIEAYQRTGDLDAARQVAKDTLAIAPDDAIARQAIDHPPAQDAAFWIDLSLAQYRQAMYAQSIQSARCALELKPDMAEAYTNIGAGYGAMGQWDEAIRNEREALRLKPGLQIARNNLEWYLKRRVTADGARSPESAAEMIDESLRFNQAGKYAESLVAARAALRLDPNSAEAWNNIAAADESLHRWDQAISAARKAVALKPGFQLARNNLAWSLAQKAAEK